MKIKKLSLKNFRGFEDLTIDFPEGESGLAVFVGVNGSGKTSVLEAIARLLDQHVSDLFTEGAKRFWEFENQRTLNKNYDIAFGKERCGFWIDLKIGDELFEPNLTYHKDSMGGVVTGYDKETAERLKLYFENQLSKNYFPTTVFYQTNRLIDEPELKPLVISEQTPYSLLRKALAGHLSFDSFFSWFRGMEDFENELIRYNQDNTYRAPELEYVRKTIESLLPGFKNPRVTRQPKEELVIEKGKITLSINSLSAGEKLLFVMAGDLVRRLAINNKNLQNPLEGEGIVLIDEIEQHLHPGWQRKIVPALRRTFPNIQFILTTHSPQVLSTLHKENVFILEDFKLVENTPHTRGRDSNSILFEIFGIEQRPESAKLDFEKLYRMMDDPDQNESTKSFLNELEEKYGYYDAEVMRARTQFEFLNE